MRTIDAAGFRKELGKRKGKVTLVNVWATWCAPCVKAYPDLVRIANRYRSKGLEVISISADSAGKWNTGVVPLLRRWRPGFPVFLAAKQGDALIEAIDPKWQGELPADVLFGPDGKRIESYTGETDMKLLERRIVQALAPSPPR